MGIKTDIEWADSTVNGMMGCDGCELYNPKNFENGKPDRCYAFYITKRYGDKPGWPQSFDKPKLFPERFAQIEKWKDLTGTKRPHKPWLNGLPRHIFHGDMGDYWTESLDIDWMSPYVPMLAEMPHVHMFLTKRPRRMGRFFNQLGHVPDNFMLGTSVTSRATIGRAAELFGAVGKLTNRLFLSVEPLIEDVCTDDRMSLQRLFELDIDLSRLVVIVGGESGWQARPFHLEWAENIKEVCRVNSVSFFMKQTGSVVFRNERPYPVSGKGSKLTDLPENLRVRMMTYDRDWVQYLVIK